MNKNTKIALLVPIPLLVVAGVVGIAVVMSGGSATNKTSVLSASTSGGTASTALNSNIGPTTIPLTPAAPAQANAPDPNQLHVNTQKQSLNDSSLQQGLPTSGKSSTGQQPNTRTTPTTNTHGPETFAQYDQYKTSPHSLFGDITVGSGNELKAHMKAAVYYKGWLTNGNLFDQSKTDAKGKLQPLVLALGAQQIITGWEAPHRRASFLFPAPF